MTRKLTSIVIGALLLATFAVPVQAAPVFAFPQFSRIDAAVAAGNLSAEQALLYKFAYVFDQAKVPAAYMPAEPTPLKCATPLIQEYERARAGFDTRTVRTIDAYLAPAGGDKATYISPLGYFQLTYLTTGTNAVPSADTNPANGVPDYVERCASYLDYSWTTEITNLGFTAPPISPYYAISFENMGAYGYTSVVSGTTTRITLENDFVGFPPNDDPDGDILGAAKVTCAHEFKHASQRPTSMWTEGGWVELDATWMEDIVYDATNDYYNYLPSGSGISSPSTSLDGGSTGTGSYEDCIWQHWMSETWGVGIILDFWNYRHDNTATTVMISYNSVLTSHGSSVTLGFPEYAAWNSLTGVRAITGYGYGEAAAYPNSNVTPVGSYPYNASGSYDHLSARNFYCTGFTNGEPGGLRVQFNGDDSQLQGLVAVIKKNDGTFVSETIPLDGNRDADVELSVPLGQIAAVSVAISNVGIYGDSKTWDLTLSKSLPDPAVSLSSASIATALDPDQTGTELELLTNDGAAGSILDYAAYITPEAPVVKALGSRYARAALPEGKTTGELRQAEVIQAPRYAGDCVLGNDDIANVQGYYGNWWWGNETYATRINPADYSCACNPGFNVRAIHMFLYLETTSSPQVRVHLAAAGADCTSPGAVLDSSAPATISGLPSNGYYDVEIPCDFTCQDMDAQYFLEFEFLDANGPVGIPIDSSPQTCVNYNDWGSGYVDVVANNGFVGDWLIYADVDCCGVATPEVSVTSPNGGELVAVGGVATITWTATVLTDVMIELSRDGGGSWETLTAGTPNDGSEAFAVSGPASQNCLVRVGSTDAMYSDVSDAAFWIYDPVGWVSVSPDSGSLDQGANVPLVLSFDSAGMTAGDYDAYLLIYSNAATSPEIVPITLTVNDTGTAVGEAPHVFALRGNVPNPFNPSTRVSFSLAAAGPVTIDVVDLHGRIVRTLFAGDLPAGERTLTWDGRDDAGRPVASGSYLARLRANGRTATHKMTLTK